MSKEIRNIDNILALYGCKVNNTGHVHDSYINETKAAIKKVVEAKLETLIKDRYLKKDNLQYWLGWVKGHKVAVKEAKEIIAKLFDCKNYESEDMTLDMEIDNIEKKLEG